MPFCTKCGDEMGADFAFCAKCGQPNAQQSSVDDFSSRMPVKEILKNSAPWAIPLFNRRSTGNDFLNDTAVANLMGLTRANSSGDYHSFWCIIGENSIGLFNDHGSLLYKEKGWAVSFPLRNLRNVRLVPGRTNMTYSNGESFVADYWILHWPISNIKPWPELEENSQASFWKQINDPINPHVDVWCNSKKDPLYENWVVVIPFEESGDPALRNRFADSLAQQIGHLPGFRKENDNLITQSIHLKVPQAGQTGGWFTVIGDMGGD
jgi:hypothetical protein